MLFLGHSGADTGAARELKRRLGDGPDAWAAGLEVWLDKDDLPTGRDRMASRTPSPTRRVKQRAAGGAAGG